MFRALTDLAVIIAALAVFWFWAVILAAQALPPVGA